MRTIRTISAAFVPILAAAALAGPTAAIAADTHHHSTGGSAATRLPGPPTWPVDPQPIAAPSTPVTAPTTPVTTSASGFDWGSAAIGAAAVVALVLALGGAAGLRRRHLARPGSLASH